MRTIILIILMVLFGSIAEAEECANILSNGGYLFAFWAGSPAAPESEMRKFWDAQLKQLCQQLECPIFCSDEKGKVSKELLTLQGKCRDKDSAACDTFFKTIKVEDRSPTNTCFYLGGKACDLCDRFGGEYCKPGMRFGKLINKSETALVYKIACKSGFNEACEALDRKIQEAAAETERKCSVTPEENICRARVEYLIDIGKIKEAVEKTLQLCRQSQYRVCRNVIPRMHKDIPSPNGTSYLKSIQEPLDTECRKEKKLDACFILAEIIGASQPEAAFGLYRMICKTSGSHLTSDVSRDSCYRVFNKSIDDKKWSEAERLAKLLCKTAKNSAQKNKPSGDCVYENVLKDARNKK